MGYSHPLRLGWNCKRREIELFPLAQVEDLGISMCKGGNCLAEPTPLWDGTESHGSSAQGCDHVPGVMGPHTSPSPLLPVHPPLPFPKDFQDLMAKPEGPTSHHPTKQDGASSDHPYPPPSPFWEDGASSDHPHPHPQLFFLGWC